MVKLTERQAAFLHEEPNVAVVVALRDDGTPQQTVVWVDSDGEHVVLNLNNFRAKLEHMRRDPRVSVLTIDRTDPFRWLGVEGKVVEITTDGAYDHIVNQARIYLGRDTYALGEGEERILVKIRPDRVEARSIE